MASCKISFFNVDHSQQINKEKLEELRAEMDRWITEIGDQPNLPEAELIEQLWKGAETQPQTAEPVITSVNGKTLTASGVPC